MNVFFFYRLLHHRFFYKRIHKIHHDFQAPMSITAVYAHPIEHIIGNMTPILAGPLILGSHIAVVLLWFLVALQGTVIDHMGYHLPFLKSPEFHDYHHLKFTCNFGVFGLLDWFHKTDLAFRRSKAHRRHKILLGFTPLSKSIC